MRSVDATTDVPLELDDIQAGALYERPSPYVGTYLLLRIDDRADGRELVRRLHAIANPAAGAGTADETSVTVAFTYHGLKALGVPQASLDSFAPEFRQGMAARADDAGGRRRERPRPLGDSRSAAADVHVAIAVLSPDEAERAAVAERARKAHAAAAGRRADLATGLLPARRPGAPRSGSRTASANPRSRAADGPPPIPTSDRSRPARSSWATPTRRASCRRCRPRRCWAATAPTSCSASCTRRWRPTGSYLRARASEPRGGGPPRREDGRPLAERRTARARARHR